MLSVQCLLVEAVVVEVVSFTLSISFAFALP